MPDYDVIVLGGGTAGSAAAAAAAAAGARVLMINDGELGGLCILRGCMPTKSMLASAHAIHAARHLEPFGARLEGRVVADFPAIMRRKDRKVERFKRAKIESIANGGYELLDARGRFAPGGGIDVGKRVLTAHRYVLATGSAPTMLPLPGLDDVPVITSDDVMRLVELPRALVVQGAGPIGLELAQFFARAGTHVLLVNRSPLLSRYDPECGEVLGAALCDEPDLELAVPGSIRELRPRENGLVAFVDEGDAVREFAADAVLMAAGRHAQLDGIGLEQMGIERDGRLLSHDEAMRTTHPDVYAAGDVTGTAQILHMASQEGRVAGHNAAVGRPERRIDHRLKMNVIFTDPPFAEVGLREAEARSAGRDIVVAAARLPETGRAITMDLRHGLWKLYADRGSGEILGTSILGPRADDLVHQIATLMHFRGTVDDLLELPWYHPTVSEVMLDLARDLREQRA